MTIGSVVKAFKIIETLSRNGEMGVTGLSEATEWDKSTIYRLLSTLKGLGYVRQNPSNQQYHLSVKFLALARSHLAQQGLVDQARPYLERLNQEADEACKLAVLDGINTTYIDCIESHHLIKVNVAVGRQFPAHTVAVGKAIMAFMDPDEIELLFPDDRLETRTPRTVATRKALMTELALIRQRGYAIDNEECSAGLYCLAAPVFDGSGRPVAGISVGFPTIRQQTEDERQRLADLVVTICEELSAAMGYRPDE